MSQTSYSNDPAVAYAGMLADLGIRDIISRIAAARQLEEVVVTTAANTEIFTVTINGTAYTYTSDASGTKAEISAGLKLAIDAGGEPVEVTDDLTDTLLIESTDHDLGFTISVTNPATGVLTLTALVAQEESIPFGVMVVEDERVAASSSGKREGCRLPRLATDFSNRKLLGAVFADTSMTTRSSAPFGGFTAGETVPIVRKGRIWMTVEDSSSVAVGGLVYVRHVASSAEQLGAIRAVDDGSDTEVLDAQQAQFTGKVNTTLGIAVVELNLP